MHFSVFFRDPLSFQESDCYATPQLTAPKGFLQRGCKYSINLLLVVNVGNEDFEKIKLSQIFEKMYIEKVMGILKIT